MYYTVNTYREKKLKDIVKAKESYKRIDLVLYALESEGPLTCSDIAVKTGLEVSTVAGVLGALSAICLINSEEVPVNKVITEEYTFDGIKRVSVSEHRVLVKLWSIR